MQDSNALTAQRNRLLKGGAIAVALLISHGGAFVAGQEMMRTQIADNLDTWSQQFEQNINEQLPPTTQPELNLQSDRTAEPETLAAVESTEYLDSEICFEVEPCYNAEAGVDFWDIGADGAGRNPEQAVERGDGCESDTDTPCTDPDTGLLYGYWRGQFFYESPLNLD